MSPEFNVTDPQTWPMVLSIEHVGAIYGIKPTTLRHYLKPKAKTPFSPQPFMRGPYRWRKVDVLRHIEGARATTLRRVS